MIYWRGIHKLQEEMGELAGVCGKLCVVPFGKHWDEEPHVDGRTVGAPPLRQRFIEEAGDVLAAVQYIMEGELTPDERVLVENRKQFKLARFRKWGLTGVNTEGQRS